jgi:two-component system sensor histidine kinase KdpD
LSSTQRLKSDREAARRTQAVFAYPWTLATVVVTTVLSSAGRDLLALPDIVMIYMLGIMIVAARFGRWPSTVAAALSVASYDFFIVPPIFKFVVHDARHLLTFGMMFVVGLVISHLTERLRHQEIRAREEELRSSLLSTVSHDLRTPLAAITGAASTLRDDPSKLSPEEHRRLAAAICGEADRLDRLIGNLLDMTRLQFGGVQLKRQWVSLDDVVASALARVERAVDGRAVNVQLPDGVLLMSVERALLEEVFVNLLENASKYTPRQSPVDIVGRRTTAAWEIDVADRGPGIDISLREKVFEKFYRGPNQGTPGAGLGLSICRGIAEAHGGSLILEGRPGGGALFRIVLPTALNAPPLPEEPLGVPGVEGPS